MVHLEKEIKCYYVIFQTFKVLLQLSHICEALVFHNLTGMNINILHNFNIAL